MEEESVIYRKIFIYISEWILLLIVVFYFLIFQLLFLGNIAVVDRVEDAVHFPYSYSFVVLAACIFFYFYIKHLQGSRWYREVKEIIWGLFFAAAAVSSLFWFSMFRAMYPKELLSNQILLASIFLGSTLLAAQIAIKYKRKGSGTN